MSPAPIVSPELKALLRKVKLGRCLDTLPERLALAKTRSLSHGQFLELVLSDEVTRRDSASAALRAKSAGLDPSMRLELWDDSAAITYDHAMWDELCSLRFVEAAHNVVIMGPGPMPLADGWSLRTGGRQFLRGWAGFFRYGNSSQHFIDIRWYAQMRLARFVAKRHGRRPAFGRWLVGVVSADQFGLVSLSGLVVAPRPNRPWRGKPNTGGERRR